MFENTRVEVGLQEPKGVLVLTDISVYTISSHPPPNSPTGNIIKNISCISKENFHFVHSFVTGTADVGYTINEINSCDLIGLGQFFITVLL